MHNLSKSTARFKTILKGQGHLANAVQNDRAYTARAADLIRRVTDRLTDLGTDTVVIGNNSLHLMHSMQPNNYLLKY